MRNSTRPGGLLRALLVVGAISLVAVGCGDDDTGADTPDETTPDDAGGSEAATDRGPELVGDWTITTFQLAGALGEAEPVGPDPVTISFAEDGTFTFSTGCNTGDGEWAAWGTYYQARDEDDEIPEGQGIEFDEISRTESDCDDDRADQDLSIGGAIRAAMTFTVDDSSFTLLRDGNVMLAGTAA